MEETTPTFLPGDATRDDFWHKVYEWRAANMDRPELWIALDHYLLEHAVDVRRWMYGVDNGSADTMERQRTDPEGVEQAPADRNGHVAGAGPSGGMFPFPTDGELLKYKAFRGIPEFKFDTGGEGLRFGKPNDQLKTTERAGVGGSIEDTFRDEYEWPQKKVTRDQAKALLITMQLSGGLRGAKRGAAQAQRARNSQE
jgi:hypothetical protein